MKTFYLLFIALLFTNSTTLLAWDAPEILENACYQDCTPKMQKMYNEFLKTPYAPKFIPGMYSGECNHLSIYLDSNTTHYVAMLLNNSENGPYMSPILQYFGDKNDRGDWSLADGIREMAPDQNGADLMTFHPTSATSHYEDADGFPSIVYWVRQNPKTKKIFFLSWIRGFSYAFCTLTPNKNGLP